MQDDFLTFWQIYPRRQKKGDARKAWEQTKNIRPPIDQVVAAIRAQAQCDQWRKDYGQFVPLPATWLRAEQWDDCMTIELPAPERKKDRYDLANEAQAKLEAEWAAKRAMEKASA